MNARTLLPAPSLLLSLLLAGSFAGCRSKPPAVPDDAALTSQVTARLAADGSLAGQTIQASVNGGIATLNGTVTSDTARTIASQDAAQVTGIRVVNNNLVIQTPPPPTVAAAPPAPAPAPVLPEKAPSKPKKPSPMIAQSAPPPPPMPAAPVERMTPPPLPAPAPVETAPPPAPPAPPQPVVHTLTLDAGSTIPVRVTQTLDSATMQQGDKFTGAIASDIIVDGLVALPQGTPVTGHVDAVQDAAHFKGSSLLTISLTAINRKGEHIDVTTDEFTKQGEGRGKNTAEKVGGGAAVGAILGGIFGGGKGAAIGAAAGGGVGAGAQTVTRGQQVQIPSETVVRFKLSNAILVRVTTGGAGAPADSGTTLERRTSP
jgi:outer membrane biosynthesis protein TonB